MSRRSATACEQFPTSRLVRGRLVGLVLGLGLAVLAAGCSAPARPAQTATWSLTSQRQRVQGRIQIRRFLRDLELAESTGNLEALGLLYADDATWMPPEGPLVHGRDGILGCYEALFADMEVSLELTDRSVELNGDRGQVLGWVAVSLTPRVGGLPELQKHQFRMVVEREPEHPWQIGYLEWTAWEDLDEPLDDKLVDEAGEDPEALPEDAGP